MGEMSEKEELVLDAYYLMYMIMRIIWRVEKSYSRKMI